MKLGKKSSVPSERTGYETSIGYLKYGYTSNILSIPARIRERHFTEDTSKAYLQAIGWAVQVYIPSPRDSIAITIESSKEGFSTQYERTLSGSNTGHLSAACIEDLLEQYEEEIPARVRVVGGDNAVPQRRE